MDFVIKTENLSRRFGEKHAVTNLSLNVPRGAVYGFLGPNGAGKTTTIRMLLGLARPSSGQAWVLGEKISTTDARYLNKVGFLPDVPNYYNWMRGEEFLFLVGEMFKIPRPELKIRVAELLETTGLKGVKTRIGGYSRGMKQRLGLAQALINKPDLVFLDEPTSALDPIGRKEVLEAIATMAQNCTVFFSTHILSDVERICNRVGILKEGHLVREESIHDLRSQFAQSAVSIEVAGNADPLLAAIREQKWSQFVELSGEKIRVTAYDLTQAQLEIPGLVSSLGLGLKRFEPVELNLEDIFVKLVNGQ